jgi:hypothetical protein
MVGVWWPHSHWGLKLCRSVQLFSPVLVPVQAKRTGMLSGRQQQSGTVASLVNSGFTASAQFWTGGYREARILRGDKRVQALP